LTSFKPAGKLCETLRKGEHSQHAFNDRQALIDTGQPHVARLLQWWKVLGCDDGSVLVTTLNCRQTADKMESG